jgi:iron complex outermembrane receptor protein
VLVQVGGDLPTSQLLSHQYNAGRNGNNEVSWFANLTAHPTEPLELSGGARYIIDKQTGAGPTVRASHTIWTASASYHFTPAVMGYVNAGSAFRQGGLNLGFAYQPQSFLALPLTNLPQYFNISPESSTSYEVGLKSQFLNRKLTLNVDYYHQDFTNFQYVTPDYLYLEGIGNPAKGFPPNFGILLPPVALGTENVPVKVDGVEADFNYRFNTDAGFGGSASYADGRVTGNTPVPCPGSISTLTVTHQVNTCVGGPASNAPRFSGSLHADYAHAINDTTTGFIRGQMSYFGATPTNAAILAADKVSAYALFNLYAGIRAPDSAWEITLFAKNLFNDSTRLQAYGGNQVAATAARAYGVYGPPATSFSSYTYIGTPIPREFGVTVRYAFGSR